MAKLNCFFLQKKHFPTLYALLENAKKDHGDSLLGQVLDAVAAKIYEVSPHKLPITYVKNYFKANEAVVKEQIKNSPHVCRNTRPGLETALIHAVNFKSQEIL
jgi:hypothetical protein